VRARIKGKQKNRVCFTLVELVVVLVIIAILAAAGLSFYRNTMTKTKAAKAQNAITLIMQAEKIFEIDNGFFAGYNWDLSNVTIGAAVTGTDLASVDSDTDFRYLVTNLGLIRGTLRRAIGTCTVGALGEIRYNLVTETWAIPACYR